MMNFSGPAVGAMGCERGELDEAIVEFGVAEVVSEETTDAVLLVFGMIVLDGEVMIEELP